MDTNALVKEARDKVEAARAALMDALDELDGVDDGRFDRDGFRARISAEVGRGTRRVQENPVKGVLVAAAVGAAAGAMAMLAFGRPLIKALGLL